MSVFGFIIGLVFIVAAVGGVAFVLFFAAHAAYCSARLRVANRTDKVNWKVARRVGYSVALVCALVYFMVPTLWLAAIAVVSGIASGQFMYAKSTAVTKSL